MMRQFINIIESAQAEEVPWHSNDYITIHVGSTTLKYAVYRDRVDIVDLDTPRSDRGKGQAKAAMTALIRKADEKGAGIQLLSYPQDDVTQQGKLNAFYRKLGFKKLKNDPDGGVLMFREPRRAPIVEMKAFRRENLSWAKYGNTSDFTFYQRASPAELYALCQKDGQLRGMVTPPDFGEELIWWKSGDGLHISACEALGIPGGSSSDDDRRDKLILQLDGGELVLKCHQSRATHPEIQALVEAGARVETYDR